ncbi:serine/threonine-protein kinase RsbW [Nocardioides terrae]|uniref:Serine/threonine-protein kinase RsbW n=1 Tax=Nocardioides terrae TaxID=574651 RepID=A0A1I1DDX9_9ACTN|nr:anti-sigma factor [Nocardioides terrae]SFB73057.1 serine/threonine-protein kinase RsbW [Nocardioides terrae]
MITRDTTSDVELRLPTDSAFISVLRTATAGLAARLDFTLDDLEDVRMAVGEAAALVLEAAEPGADLTIRYWLAPRELTIAVSTTAGSVVPERDSFAWTVLTTLAEEATATTEEGIFQVTLRTASSIDVSGGDVDPRAGVDG